MRVVARWAEGEGEGEVRRVEGVGEGEYEGGVFCFPTALAN